MKRVRLRTILLTVNLFVLAVPLAGIYTFHIYENQLVRQVESELIAQGAYASAFYASEIHREANAEPCSSAVDVHPTLQAAEVAPVLNLASDRILPTRPDAHASASVADDAALRAGKAVYPVLSAAAGVTLAGFRIVDCHGIVVAGRNELGQSLADVPEVEAALAGSYQAAIRARTTDNPHPALASISRGANIRVFVAVPIRDGGRVIGAILLSRTPRNIAESLYDERYAVLTASGIVLAFTCLLGLVTSRAIARPIAALQRQAQSIGRGDRDVRPLRQPVTLEIAELSETLVTMGRVLGERATYIQDFAAHMSHEFKTPLTAIQGALELIQEHSAEMDTAQMQQFVSNAIQDTERLKLLVARLLELARADMMRVRDEACDLGAILMRLQPYHETVTIEAMAPGEATLPIPDDVAQALLTTMLTNSTQHGATKIAVALTRLTDCLTVVIADNGAGISPANAEKLFVPFFTTRRDTGGTGLGLVIVRSMLNAYGADIAYSPGERGARFIVTLPAGRGWMKP